MEYSVKESSDKMMIFFSGQLVLESIDKKGNEIIDLVVKSGKDTVVDLSGVDYVDSTGIGLFLKLSGIQKNRGKSFKIVNLSDRVVKIFELSSLGELI